MAGKKFLHPGQIQSQLDQLGPESFIDGAPKMPFYSEEARGRSGYVMAGDWACEDAQDPMYPMQRREGDVIKNGLRIAGLTPDAVQTVLRAAELPES